MTTVGFKAPVETVFIEEGFDPAYFVVLPDTAVAMIAEHRLASGLKRSFGTVRVTAQIGSSEWSTTLNPVKGGGGWTLPLKKPVRLAEGFEEGDTVEVELTFG